MKLLIHVEEIIPRVPVYHVGVGYKIGPLRFRYDYQPEKGWGVPVMGRKRVVDLGSCKKNIFEVHSFQKKLQEQKYFLGFRDCRHFSQKLVEYSSDTGMNVVNLFNLNNLFHRHP